MAEKETDVYQFGNSMFATNLYNLLKNEDGNVFFSPYSLQVVLAMAYAGSGGNTAKQFQKHLQFPENKKALEEAVGGVLTSFKNTKNVTLNSANGMFVQKDFNVKPAFTKSIADAYQSLVKNVNFDDSPATAKEINDFVSKNTNAKIKELFQSDAFTPLTKLVLVNAIYFKGSWKHKFDPAKTSKGDFHLNSTDKVQVDYMTIKERFNYGESEDLKASIIELKYEGDVSMVLVVPQEIEGIKELEEKIVKMDLNTLTSKTYSREVILKMPKFKLEQSLKLGEHLKKLGLVDMFEMGKADFPEITERNDLFVSDAIQKSFIEVNEEGAEAAAATGFQFNMRMMPLPPQELHVKSPFLFFLFSNDGTLLFVGRLAKP